MVLPSTIFVTWHNIVITWLVTRMKTKALKRSIALRNMPCGNRHINQSTESTGRSIVSECRLRKIMLSGVFFNPKLP